VTLKINHAWFNPMVSRRSHRMVQAFFAPSQANVVALQIVFTKWHVPHLIMQIISPVIILLLRQIINIFLVYPPSVVLVRFTMVNFDSSNHI